jgi:GntR family transcriptional regulator
MLKRDQRVAPLYYQVQHTIAQRINRGEYPPGSQLPSESELSRELGVSRVTLREALRVLAEENLLVKAQGRGTFVAEHARSSRPPRTFTGYLEDLWDQLDRVSVKDIDISRIPLTDEFRAILTLPEDEKEAIRIKRTRYVDNEPYAFTINVLPLNLGQHFSETKLKKTPLVRVLEEDLKIQITGAFETISATTADTEVANALGIAFLSPVMHVRRVLFTIEGNPLQVVDSYYRADKFHYSVHLVRVQDKGKWSWSQKAVSEPVLR